MLSKFLRSTILPATLLSIALALPHSAAATTLTVTNFGDSGAPGQLRALINAADPGDTIVIPAGIITLTGAAGEDANVGGDLDIRFTTLTIQGAGPGVTIIDGGGIDRVFEIVAATATVSGMTIRNGNVGAVSIEGAGGGIYNDEGTLTLTGVTVSGNTSGFRGGGIYNQAGAVTLANVTVSGNTAGESGGGIANNNFSGATLTLTNVIVSNNTAGSAGGGISAGGTVTLSNVTISNNLGGGLVNLNTMTLTNSTISGNTATFNGGGLVNAGTATLTNVTVSGNTAGGVGGGIVNFDTLTLTNVTLTGNSAASGGNLDDSSAVVAGFVQLQNTIVANSPAGGNCSGTITSLGHNLDSGTTCGFTGPGDLSNTNPLLAPLANNGGPTQTHALLPGSPAINAGDNTGCPTTDQRGIARPQGGTCDIGAYEVVVVDPAAVSAFVTRLYQTVLGREPDPPGLAAFIDQIQQFGTVIPTVLAFFKSEEFLDRHLDDVQFLTVLYRTFLNREPDPDGLAAFLGLLASGCRTRDTLIAALSFSGEFRALVPPVPVADLRVPFLAEIFAWTLNRPPDPGGFASFLAQLQRSTAVSTITGFLHSQEFTVPRKAPGEYVSSLYLVFLGRPPDCDGLFSFVGALTPDTDAKRDQLAAQFAGSGEFQAILDRVFP